ncbi:caspase family protein [Anatilimnocola floriformis]|uniref:caspase family protein n=1 Tax=Anatilimnocola floriformis TaxID=2948575 RepID=UPI0020C2FFDC|nr:caspase family protein [Anatilimnocola floriformis]
MLSRVNIAILIAVEQHAEPQFPARQFAAADVRGMSAVLVALGYVELDQVVLIDGQATKTIIESKIRRTIRSLSAEDTLLVYVAAHGFAERGKNYLIGHDTQAADATATSIAWSTVLTQLRDADCERVLLFVDSCSQRVREALPDYDSLNHEEFEQFVEDDTRRVCFLSCGPDETSWTALKLQHGAWASQILAACSGTASSALVNKELLTASSLQKFLETSLPRVLQKSSSEKRTQTPICFAPSQEILLADLSDVLAERKSAGKPRPEDVLQVTLLREQVESIRSLAGFKKTDKVPTAVNSYARSLVADLGSGPIAADVEEVREALRKHFSFKRKDLDSAAPGDGTGSILTPYFVYSVTVTLNPANPAEIIWRRTISDIREPDQVLSPAFENVFPKTFSTVEFQPPQPIDLATFIDELEDSDDDRVKLNYDPATTWCRLSMPGLIGQVEVTQNRFALLQLSPTSPGKLLESFFKIQAMLVQELEIKAIGFGK